MKHAETKLPELELATREFTMYVNRDTEGRIEKAFREQMEYFDKKFENYTRRADERHDATVRWGAGLIISAIVMLIVAVLFGT